MQPLCFVAYSTTTLTPVQGGRQPPHLKKSRPKGMRRKWLASFVGARARCAMHRWPSRLVTWHRRHLVEYQSRWRSAAGLGAAGLPVVVVNPAQVRAFAQALGKRAKTDPIDAAVIARFAVATRPAIRPLADAETTALADMLTRRRQIIQMPCLQKDRAEGQREKRASKRMTKSIQRLRKALQKELTDIDREIPHGSRDNVRRQVAALAGLAPFTRQSGQ